MPLSGIVHQFEQDQLRVDGTVNDERAHESTNVAPQTYNATYISKDGEHYVEYMKWGLVPPFAKEHMKYSTFNCRAESLKKLSPLWRSVKTNRAVIVMNGYYEWHHEGKQKTPYYITRKDGQLMFALGLWAINEHMEGQELRTYSIITTTATPELAKIHPRMPAFVEAKDVLEWTDGEWPEVLSLIRSTPDLEHYRVSDDVNKVSNKGANLNKPLTSVFNAKKANAGHQKSGEADDSGPKAAGSGNKSRTGKGAQKPIGELTAKQESGVKRSARDSKDKEEPDGNEESNGVSSSSRECPIKRAKIKPEA